MPPLLPFDVISLKSMVEFIGSLAKEAALKRFKPKESKDKARDALFMLFLQLGVMDKGIDVFILCIQNRRVGVFSSMFKEQLRAELTNILESLDSINDALRSLDPQLSIYAPELLASIEQFQINEAETVDTVPPDLPELPALADEGLESLLQQAMANQLVLKASIANLRTFIKSELPFSESFR
jgi:hypothetical protein